MAVKNTVFAFFYFFIFFFAVCVFPPAAQQVEDKRERGEKEKD